MTHWEAWPTSQDRSSKTSTCAASTSRCRFPSSVNIWASDRDRWLEFGSARCRRHRQFLLRCDRSQALGCGFARQRRAVQGACRGGAASRLGSRRGWSIEWVNGRFTEYTGIATRRTFRKAHGEDPSSGRLRLRSRKLWSEPTGRFDLRTRDSVCVARRTTVYRWFLSKGVPVRDAEGEVIRWIGTNTEIHEEKAAASESRASQFQPRRTRGGQYAAIANASGNSRAI